jgi:HEAT repeat protein
MGILRKLVGPPNVEKLKKKGDIRGLVKALGHEDFKVRQDAFSALYRLEDPRSVPLLIEALSSPSHSTRKSASSLLGKMAHPRAVRPLTSALADPTIEVRKDASIALGRIGDAAALMPLIAVLQNENEYASVRKAAARSLGQLGDARAFEPLMQALRHRELAIRDGAARGLGSLGDLRALEPLIEEAGIQIKWLPSTISRGRAHDDHRCGAASGLGSLGDPRAVPVLVSLLKDWNATLRVVAARALGQIGDPQALEALLDASDDIDSSVRDNVNRALKAMDPAGELRSGLQRAQATPESRVRKLAGYLFGNDEQMAIQAASALGSISSPEAVGALVRGLEGDAHGAVELGLFRRIVAELARLDKDLLVEKLCGMYGKLSRMHGKRVQIVEALGTVGGEKATAILREAVRDDDLTIVSAAKRALKRLEEA